MSRKNRTYKTIDNGGTAFIVEVGKTVSVFKDEHLFTVTPEKIFIGKTLESLLNSSPI